MGTINMISAEEYDIKYYQNDNFSYVISVTKDGVAVDLSGKTLLMQVKKIINRDDYVMQFSTASGTIVVSGANNNILTFTTDYAFKAGTYFYDLDNKTDKETIMFGKLIVTQDVTR